MTAGERRGARLFLILATLTVLVKLGGIFLELGSFGHGAARFIAPVLALSVPFLWRGTVWLQRLVGLTSVLSGAMSLFDCVRSLIDIDVLGASVVFEGFLGLVDVLAGLAFLFLPDLNAFFRYQREGKPKGAADEDRKSPTLPSRRRLKAACGWGLALGCGSGILLAARWAQSMHFGFGLLEVVVGFLVGVGAGGLVGVVAGLAVGAAGPGAGQTTLRLTVTRGLIAAGACVVTAVVGAAIYGGLFGKRSAFHGNNPGSETSALAALIWAVYGGPMLAAAGFVLGVAITLLVRDSNSEKLNAAVGRSNSWWPKNKNPAT